MNYGQFITEIQKYYDLRDKGLNKQTNRFLFAFTNRFKENVSEKEADDILFQFCKEYVDEKKFSDTDMPDRLQFLFQKLSDIWIIFLTQCRLECHITAFLIRFAVQRKGISHDTFRVAVIGIDEPFAGGCLLDFLFNLFGQGVKKTLVLA